MALRSDDESGKSNVSTKGRRIKSAMRGMRRALSRLRSSEGKKVKKYRPGDLSKAARKGEYEYEKNKRKRQGNY